MDTNLVQPTGKNYRKKLQENDAATAFVEEQTKVIPPLSFLGIALAGMAASAAITFGARRKEFGNFVGLWVPTILIMGLYNKIVNLEDELLNLDAKH